MKNVNSYKVANNLYINSLRVSDGPPTRNVPTNINHIVVIDCSGSMYGELAKIAAALKSKIPTMVREGDTLSVIWFSGRGEYGPILEGAGVATLRDLKKINDALDRYLRPVGMTGFREPLEETSRMIDRISKTNSNPFALFFMSDGMDNQWSRAEILRLVEVTAKSLASSTFVEYGHYADRQMLSSMAEKAGGQLVHADNFAEYEPLLEASITKEILGGKRVEIDVPSNAIGGIVFEMSAEEELITYDATSGKALVSEGTEDVWWLSNDAVGTEFLNDGVGAQWAAMSLFAVRMKPDIVWALLKSTGDVRFIKQFANCFGKQAYSAFMDATREATFYPQLRCRDGRDPNLVPPDDAFTVFDLLKTLSDDDNTRVYLDDPSFDYSAITRAQLNADENLTMAERGEVETLINLIKRETKPAKIKELQDKIDAILATKREGLKFVPEVAQDGYEIGALVFNAESPNVSIGVQKHGTVDLSSRSPGGLGLLSVQAPAFKTHIFRNYAIIAHGIVNVKTLPVDISRDVYRKLAANGVRLFDNERGVTCIDLTTLPIINRKMVQTVSLKDAAQIAWEHLAARAAQKVYRDYVKTRYPNERDVVFEAIYGAQATEWLKENGITERNGFSPPRTQAESTDFIMGKELAFKIKGYSTLPPVAKVLEKVAAKGKLNGPETLMAQTLLDVETWLKKNPEKLHRDWLVGQEKLNSAVVRSLAHQLSQIVFSIILGQTWFSDCTTLDDKTATLKTPHGEVVVAAELSEIEIKL